MSEIPVLWLCGAPGVGKSTVAWAVYERLSVEHEHIAYVDIDQLGMLLPAPAVDQDRHRLKADALSAVIAHAQAVGAGALVVSGVLDTLVGADIARKHPTVTFCRISVTPDVLSDRLAARGWSEQVTAQAISETAELSAATFIQQSLEGADRTPADLAADVASMITPTMGAIADPFEISDSPAGHGLLITGPRAVGKSTVSWSLFMRSIERATTGYVDLDQLGFISNPEQRDRFRAANLAGVWRVFHAAGATRMIINGQITSDALAVMRTQASGLDLDVIGLVADESSYRLRIADRRARGPAELAGDDLLGADEDHQADVLSSALTEDALMRRAPWVDRIIDTSALTSTEVAEPLFR